MLRTDSTIIQLPKTVVHKKAIVTPVIAIKTDSSYLKHYYHTSVGNCFIYPPDSLFSESYHSQSVFVNTQTTTNKQLVNKLHNNALNHNYPFNNFTLLMLIFAFSFLAWLKITYQKYIRQLFSSVINYHDSYKLFRDQNANIDGVYLGLNLIFTIIGTFFIFQSLLFYKISIKGLQNFKLLLVSAVIIIMLYFVRFVISKLTGFLFDKTRVFNEYLHNTFVFYKVAGLILLPLVSALMFIRPEVQPYLIYTGILVILLLYILSIIRGTRIMLQKDVFLLYWILYLCTLEILPLFIAWRYIKTLA